jgi:hypothetical protein
MRDSTYQSAKEDKRWSAYLERKRKGRGEKEKEVSEPPLLPSYTRQNKEQKAKRRENVSQSFIPFL